MTIPLTPVTSSQISAIGWLPHPDGTAGILAIQFKNKDGSPGSIYHYLGLSNEDWITFASAESIGSHFYRHIKNNPQKYPYTKIQ